MTEEEAKKKVCKIVPVCIETESSTGGKNRLFYDTMIVRCVGADCMMWRWIKEHDGMKFGTGVQKYLPLTKGYCGLGGRP